MKAALTAFARHPGAEFAILLGRDGLLVDRAGGTIADAEALAAGVPAIAASTDTLGEQLALGRSRTIVAQVDGHTVLIEPVTEDYWAAVLVGPGANFSGLLADLRTNAPQLDAFL